MSEPMATGSNAEPAHGSVGPVRYPSIPGLRAAAGFLLTSLPLGAFWFVVLAVPILLGVFLAAFWVVVIGLILAVLSWTGRPQRQKFVRGLALISAPLTLLSGRCAQAERRRIARSLGYQVSSPYRRVPTLDSAHARAEDPAVWRDLPTCCC